MKIWVNRPCWSTSAVTPSTLFLTTSTHFIVSHYISGWIMLHHINCITFLYNDIERHSIYQNVQLFIRSKNNILNAAVFKYSLHKVRETILH